MGEAVSALAAHQAASATPVTVMLPLYRCVREVAPSLEALGPDFTVAVGSRVERARLRTFRPARLTPRIVFIDLPAFFDRDGLYGERGAEYGDNALRYAFFCRAALWALPRVAPTAAVVHAHDWHAALAPVYLRTLLAKHPVYRGLTAVLSLHNAAFQGRCPADTFPTLGLPWSLYDWRLLEWYGQVNLLKGGLAFSDAAVAVSPTHSRELCTRAGGFGLHDHFTALGGRLTGVTNGIDVTTWDPAADPHLPAGYTASRLEGKRRCKADLQAALGLSVRPETPLIALCARLTEQKGLDLVLEGGLPLHRDAQFAFLGEGEARYVSALHGLAAEHPGRIAAVTAFRDALEHRLLGGADLVMMPSLYEPCGLTQLRAQRYGTIPVARRVGGLADTIEDGISGFLFQEYGPAALRQALERALDAFASPAAWLRLVRAAMRREVGWGPPARAYAAIYQRTLEQRQPRAQRCSGRPGGPTPGQECSARA
jgi:starch synthase